MNQYGPLISYDTSLERVTMRVSASIVEHVKQVFDDNYRLPIDEIAREGDVFVFTFNERVDSDTFLRHLRTGKPEEYGSI